MLNMRTLLAAIALTTLLPALAQFPIGERTITFFDATRNRNIETWVRYPGQSAGANAVVADGPFPLLVMGHGFAMAVGAYANLWEHFVPKGYIMVLPTTEGGLLPGPDHGAFGQDLAFLVGALQAANSDAGSPFFGRVAPATALMGHSMGGGASFLGAANNTTIQALVNFAPAETTPSAIAAAANVTVPTIVFAGTNDCVTPIAQHQGPMYAALTTSCRAFVNILGGGHCFFANSNINCTLGELTCSPSPSITRAEQHDVVNDFAGLWLDHFLKGLPGAFDAVSDSLHLSTRVAAQFTCGITTALGGADRSAKIRLAPVPATDRVMVSGLRSGALLRVFDIMGVEVIPSESLPADGPLDVRALPSGTYRLLLLHEGRTEVHTFLIAR